MSREFIINRYSTVNSERFDYAVVGNPIVIGENSITLELDILTTGSAPQYYTYTGSIAHGTYTTTASLQTALYNCFVSCSRSGGITVAQEMASAKTLYSSPEDVEVNFVSGALKIIFHFQEDTSHMTISGSGLASSLGFSSSYLTGSTDVDLVYDDAYEFFTASNPINFMSGTMKSPFLYTVRSPVTIRDRNEAYKVLTGTTQKVQGK